jgi:hypothetical protein
LITSTQTNTDIANTDQYLPILTNTDQYKPIFHEKIEYKQSVLNTNKLYSRVNTDQYEPGQAPGPIGPKTGPITASTIHHPNRRHQRIAATICSKK